MLDKQINMYSVDTGHFYTNTEKYLHNMNCKYRQERNYIVNKVKEIYTELIKLGYTQSQINLIKNDKLDELEIISDTYDLVMECYKWEKLIVHKRKKAHESKDKILKLFENKINQNELTNGKDHIRCLREQDLNDVNIISVFESSLTRTLNIKQDEFTNDLITVQVYYFDVFKDLCFYGFMFKGEKYRYYTSSAGQIRKKKAVFIKESIWNKFEKTLMCGLTINSINEHGGSNVN